MKLLLIGIVLAMTACSTTPPQASLARLKHDQRSTLTDHCMKAPEQFGFPYTRAQNADLLSFAPGYSRNVYSYCSRAARILVR